MKKLAQAQAKLAKKTAKKATKAAKKAKKEMAKLAAEAAKKAKKEGAKKKAGKLAKAVIKKEAERKDEEEVIEMECRKKLCAQIVQTPYEELRRANDGKVYSKQEFLDCDSSGMSRTRVLTHSVGIVELHNFL